MPTKATATASLTFCWNPQAEDDITPGSAQFRTAFAARLEGAGYKLVAKGRCDVHTHWSIATSAKGGEASFTTVLLTVKTAADEPLEKIKVERERGEVPIDKADLVAVPIVNTINASPAIATYASKRNP